MRARTVRGQTILSCPILSLSPQHYNADGSCKCKREEKKDVVGEEDSHAGANRETTGAQ